MPQPARRHRLRRQGDLWLRRQRQPADQERHRLHLGRSDGIACRSAGREQRLRVRAGLDLRDRRRRCPDVLSLRRAGLHDGPDGRGSGTVTATYGYDVFGAIRSQTGGSANGWLFTGEQRDPQQPQLLLPPCPRRDGHRAQPLNPRP